MRDYSLSDIRATNSAYNKMLAESFLSRYDLKYDVNTPYGSGEARSKFTKMGVPEFKEYINSLNTRRSIKVFLDMDIHELRRMCTIKYGLEFIGEGSSRIVFSATDNSIIKIAFNMTGMLQNKAEVHDKNVKNDYGCFPYIFWTSKNNYLALECEKVEQITNENEFGSITGVDFDDYLDYVDYYQMIITKTPHRRFINLGVFNFSSDTNLQYQRETYEYVAKDLNDESTGNVEAKRVLKNFADYVANHRDVREFIMQDLRVLNNWGKVKRNGQTVCVPSDTGGTSHILTNYYDGEGNPKEI